MSSSERSIPHLRDIFGLSGYSMHNHHSPTSNGTTGSGFSTTTNNAVGNYNSGDQNIDQQPQQQQDSKKHNSRKKRDNNKTLTSGDVKTLERHLSMKKTIRKKIMRDLQQAFVEDPNEFKIENTNSEQLKAEIRAEALRFGCDKPTARKSDNFLDMLRGEKTNNNTTNNYNDYSASNNNVQNNREYDYDNTTSSNNSGNSEKQSFWRRFTMKNKTKR